MTLNLETEFTFDVEQATDVLLQFEAAVLESQAIESSQTLISPALALTRVTAEAGIGERIWLPASGMVSVRYSASVKITRSQPALADLDAIAPHDLPAEAVAYLLDSRYCPAEQFQAFVDDEFGTLSGGARIDAIRAWIASNFTYASGSSGPETGAVDSFVARRGVCRDYAHVLISLARASAIPARYVSCYAPGVDPPDFHAVVEVFLAEPSGAGVGAWHLVDATGMADPCETAIIGVGRDAADVSFLTSFGPSNFGSLLVRVTKE
ncbi:transglutaminase-like domain-containing protein [Erythrobacter mangrovi]|uniref:Transglutaminase family protein n=1 Tax=Erythrobacter mangrovi TaxID=2739433 RepID=A0A7D4B8N0_9SPHN|nr:transglutaminase family protein [Erythrobacter mangrovi]QKG72043.1 transglutaminase family protein [Erythrobacter mangrovi]